MLHLYSKGCEYAIHALSNISRAECRSGFAVKSVCKKAGLPEPFTRKIFQTLVKNRILIAKRGPGGGYRFKKDPEKISVLSIVYAIDGKNTFDKCVAKNNQCDSGKNCSLHPMWKKTKNHLINQLKKSTVAELMKEEA